MTRSKAWLGAVLGACASDPGTPAADTTHGGDTSITAGSTTSVATSADDVMTESDVTTATSTSDAPVRSCNGVPELCDRTLDEVTFPTTHNSAAAMEYGFAQINANQTHGLRRQLDDGIRGVMLDVTEVEGETLLCHGPCALGQIPHVDALTILGEFLAENPDEVLFIIYEDSAPATAIEADWQSTGLVDEAFVLGDGPWPTLGAMIDARTRIVVTAENAGPPPPWLHHAWSLVWDTPYTFHSLRELSCAANRGTPGEGLFLVNHWLSTDADLPDEAAAAEANAYDVLLGRAQACEAEWGHRVNLLGVDYYEQGDLFEVVAALQ